MDVDNHGHYEYVPGYADIKSYQVLSPTTAAIQMKEVATNDKWVPSTSPIVLSAWQFLRLNLPQYAYPGSQWHSGTLVDLIECLAGILSDVESTFFGFDELCLNSFGRDIVPNYSYIRLDNPIYKILGGGCRVSDFDISDNWSTMLNGQSAFTYGQTMGIQPLLPLDSVAHIH